MREPPALLAGALFIVLALMIALAAAVQDAAIPLYGLALLNAVAGGFFLVRAFRGPTRRPDGQREEI